MRKSLSVILIVFIFIGFLVSLQYSKTYNVSNKQKDIEISLEEFLLKSGFRNITIDIKSVADIDNKKYVLFNANNLLVYAEFIKGFNNKYKIRCADFGCINISNEVIETNKGRYFLSIGRKANEKIKYIIASIEFKKYKLELPKEEYFITYCIVDPKASMAEWVVYYYDENNKDITDEVLSK